MLHLLAETQKRKVCYSGATKEPHAESLFHPVKSGKVGVRRTEELGILADATGQYTVFLTREIISKITVPLATN